MKSFAALLLFFPCLLVQARTLSAMNQAASDKGERLGTVTFSVSCAPAQQAAFNRGVALLHDFWYEEAHRQFDEIAKADPGCSMAYWGEAMSEYHQIWNRPNEKTMKLGLSELEKAQSAPPKTDRERDYIAALANFYQAGPQEYPTRVAAYSAAMSKLYSHYPDDTDAGAFYALSLLAAAPPDDTSLANNHKALAVLTPLFVTSPNNPGVSHYIIHACDTPSLAQQGLAAAVRYGEIAPSAPHSAHMPGHIFARLGMWPEDINANLASVAASQSAEARHLSGAFDQLHSYDFLLYAYLQSGQDADARDTLDKTTALLNHFETMPNMSTHGMEGMLPYYRIKFSVFYNLERRDWKSAAALQPVPGAMPEAQALTYWARLIADGHTKNTSAARADLIKYDALLDELKKSKQAFLADSTGVQIEAGEVRAWVAFAEGNNDKALKEMRAAADLQDKVGQGEVDIPAREMLADMLLELHQPQQALVEYNLSLKMSPNRFNGLYNAGRAAEAVGDKTKAAAYYATLLKIAGNGAQSERPELAYAKSFMASTQVASK